MLKDITIQPNKITLTCSLPLDLETFASNNRSLQGSDEFALERFAHYERAPMSVEYKRPKKPEGDCSVILRAANRQTPLYYEDIEKLAKLLSRRSPDTYDTLADDSSLHPFLSRARATLPAFSTQFYPDKNEPKAKVSTANGRLEIHLLADHPNYTKAQGLELVSELNAANNSGMNNTSYFTTSLHENDFGRMEKTADILVTHGILTEEQKVGFIAQTRKGILMQLAAGMQEGEAGTMMATLAKTGDFHKLESSVLQKMQQIGHMDDEGAFGGNDAYLLLKTMVSDPQRQQDFAALCQNFMPEIENALAQPSEGHSAKVARSRKNRGTQRG